MVAEGDESSGAEPAKPAEAAEVGGLALVLTRLAGDQHGLLDYLDTSLRAALPEAVRVQRDKFFNRGHANHVEILLGSQVFDLRLQHGAMTCAIGDVVGGVALSRTPCDPDQWVAALAQALQDAAATSTAVRDALTKLA